MPDETVVIVGAGQSGGRLAASLREFGHGGPITLIGDEPHLPYERPPLSKEILTGEMTPEAVGLGDAAFWADRDVTVVTGVAAVRIEPARNTIVLSNRRTLGYDHLVLATGARPRMLPGCDLPCGAVTCLRTLDDALALRGSLGPGVRIIVLGGGVIGLELAASARRRGSDVTVIEAADRVMSRVVSPQVSARLLRMHEAEGVRFHFGAVSDCAEPLGDGLRVRLRDGTVLEGDRLVVAIGVVPNDGLAAAAGIAVADGVVVDAAGRTSVANVWAIGDVARHPVTWAAGNVRQETWRHAEAHARAVAAAILGLGGDYDDVPGFWSDQYGRRLQAEGTNDGCEMLHDDPGGGFSALYLDQGKLRGCAVLDNPKIAALARKAIGRGAEFDAASLAAPGADLRKLLRG